MITADQLNFVWNGVRTNLLSVEKIDSLSISANLEVPFAEKRFSKTMDRLIS